jgi:uncharacterized protein (DUF1330 family)
MTTPSADHASRLRRHAACRAWTVALALIVCTVAIPAHAEDAAAAPLPAACATAGYIVAFQGIGGPSDAFDPRWTASMKNAGGTSIVDEVPARIYEGPDNWGRVTVVRWPCFEQAEAAWKALPSPAPAQPDVELHTAALYRGSSYPPFPDSLLRLPPNCTVPAYFMAMNTTFDEARYDVYRQAMRNTQYVQQLGSTTLFSGAPVAQLASWPAATAASMTRWACKESFHLFYYDKTYVEQIKPLRAGAIDYRILGFDDANRPR